MEMLIIENLETGYCDCEPYIPMQGQIDLIKKSSILKCEVIDSDLLALTYLDKPIDLSIDPKSIKKRIVRALELSNWVQKDAVKILKISTRAMSYQCRALGIIHESWGNKKNKRKSKLTLIKRSA